MKPLHSSISSSDHLAEPFPPAEGPTLLAFPRPTPAFFVAAATFLAMGAAFGYIGGWSHGAPPAVLSPLAAQRAYLFNATNRPRNEDVVFHGNSLMELGVIPDIVASNLKIDPRNVKNLAMIGAKVWDVEWVAERCEPPRTDGPRVAVLGIDRGWFNMDRSPFSPYARCKIAEDREASQDDGEPRRLYDQLGGYLMPARREARMWLTQFTYDWLGYRYPKLVRVPSGPSTKLWEVDPLVQQRAVAMIDTRSRQALRSGEFAEHAVSALRLIVDHLKRRSYHVVLFLPPLHQEVLESIDASPASADRERRIRRLLASPPYIGADDFVEFRDAKSLGAEDDVVFIDYGHLTREGAERQSRKLAEVITNLGLLGGKPKGREETIPGEKVPTP